MNSKGQHFVEDGETEPLKVDVLEENNYVKLGKMITFGSKYGENTYP